MSKRNVRPTAPPTLVVTVKFGGGTGAIIDIDGLDGGTQEAIVHWHRQRVFQNTPATPKQAGIHAPYTLLHPHLCVVLVRRAGKQRSDVYAGIWLGVPYTTTTQDLQALYVGS